MTPNDAPSPAGEPRRARSAEPVAGQRLLLIAMATALGGTAMLLAGVVVLVDRPDWWRALLAASVTGIFAAAVSLLPLLWGMQRGPHKAVLGFFVAGGVRAAIAIGGGLLAVHVGGYPLQATLLLIVAYYFAALSVEAIVLGRSLWSMKF